MKAALYFFLEAAGLEAGLEAGLAAAGVAGAAAVPPFLPLPVAPEGAGDAIATFAISFVSLPLRRAALLR